ncbi:MAG: thioester reductase, partial [Duncaniella sp.]|nr:thioester reductase [Duncaniella sp.]
MSKRTIYSRFKDMVSKYPDSPAIVDDNRKISYSQLDAMVDSIVAKFYDQKPSFVGIVMQHG